METDRYLTATEAAELLRVSKDWLYRGRRWQRLPFTVVLSQRKILFSLKGILKYMEDNRLARQNIPTGGHMVDCIQPQGEGVSAFSEDGE